MKTDFESCVQQFEILTVLRNPDNCRQLPPLLLETDEQKIGSDDSRNECSRIG